MKAEVGETIPSWTMERVAPERMRTVAAILRDPNPVHWDTSILAAQGLGERVINQGPMGLSYMLNMLMEWAGPTCIKRVRIRFPGPVFGEDRVVAGGVVKAITSAGDKTLAECDIWLDRQDGSRALEGTAVVELPA